MAWLGHYQIGDTVPIGFRAVNGSGVGVEPDAAPQASLFRDANLIVTVKVPIVDRYGTTAWFAERLFLDGRFLTAGTYQVLYHYLLSGTPYLEADEFQILAGGSPVGHSMSMFFAHGMAAADYVLVQTEAGQILRKRNPRIV